MPNPKSLPHTFFEFATDVVIVGDVAWVIGASHGKHELFTEEIRGLLVPMDLHTGEVLSPVVIAPKMDVHTQSAFWGATYHPAGVVVTGYACDATCTNYRIVTSLYDAAGALLWYQSDAAGPGIRYGRDVALDSQGRAIIGGSAPESGAQPDALVIPGPVENPGGAVPPQQAARRATRIGLRIARKRTLGPRDVTRTRHPLLTETRLVLTNTS